MKNKKTRRIIYLVLVLLWMLIIFMFSSQNGEESQNASQSITRWIVKIFTTNKNNISEGEMLKLIENLDYYIRKLAHYSIYVLGGILIYSYINTYEMNKKTVILISILIGIIYAISDESHQYFMPERSAQILDVFIDSFGIITGVIISCIIGKQKTP